MVDILSFTGVTYKSYFDFWKQHLDTCADGFRFRQYISAETPDTHTFQQLDCELDCQLSERIFQLVNHSEVGIYVTLITGLTVLFQKYSRQSVVVLDSPPHQGLTSEAYTSTRVPLIIPVQPQATWKEHLVRTQETIRHSYQYQNYPLQLIDQTRTLGDHIYSSNIAVSYQGIHQPAQTTNGYDWIIDFRKEDQTLKANIQYNTAVFKPEFIQRAWQHLQVLLANLNHLDHTIQQSSVFSDQEYQQLLAIENRTPRPMAVTLHGLFENQATQTPEAIALVYQTHQLTYQALNEHADRLAHYLRNVYQVQPNQRIGLMAERSERMIIGLLAILKAGATYLPIDPAYPTDRKSFMLADANITLLLTDSEHLFDLSFYEGELFAMDIQLDDLPASLGVSLYGGGEAAYVIYTSGSTGQPKGVVVPHSGCVNMCLSQIELFGIQPSDKVLQFASLSFDASVSEIFMALLAGATLVLPDKQTIASTNVFETYLQQQAITVVTLPPVYLHALDKEKLHGLRVLITAGEAAYVSDAVACSQFCQYFNAYGPTECSVCVAVYEVSQADAGRTSIPIGKPIANTEVYVLDETGDVVPVGLPGELWVSGAGLATGYLHREELTQEKFCQLPLLPGKRLYRTGDLVRWGFDGNLEFISRKDEQIKLRGYRIEPGEVAATIKQHPGVQEAFVLKATSEDLMAVIVPHPEQAAVLYQDLQKKSTPTQISRHTLPNGLVVYHKNRFETDVLYEEIFLDKVYQQGGIRLPQNSTIVDVGANIGMFSLYAGLHLSGKTRIYAFEPVAEIYEVLLANTNFYQLPVKAFQAGLSDSEQIVSFTYYPNNTAMSGRYGDASQDKQTVRQAIQNKKFEGESLGEDSLDLLVEERVAAVQVTCQMRRLSDVMREENIEVIDLLKIDVEKSEQEVLAGIDAEDWPKIKQIAIEVHETNGQIAALEHLLSDRGFAVVVVEEESLSGTGLFNVYATRPDQPLADDTCELNLNAGGHWTLATALIDDIKQLCQRTLPDYMVPTVFRLTSHLPLTANGKVDKKALLQLPDADTDQKTTYVAPRTPLEQQLVEIWEEILGRKPIGVQDDFFDLGGHSLKATRLVSRLYKQMQITLDLGNIFTYPTIEKLARIVENSVPVGYESIPKISQRDTYELSHSQRRLWILDQFEESRQAYIIPSVYPLHDIDTTVFEMTIRTLIERHESLRTTICIVDGEPMQQVQPIETVDFQLTYRNLQAEANPADTARKLALRESITPFDLQKGPLFRLTLLQIAEKDYLLLLTMHHIISDGWTMQVLSKEIMELYQAYSQGQENPLLPLRIQYKDYAAWQHVKLRTAGFKKHEEYWLSQFHDPVPVINLPTDFSRPVLKSFHGGSVMQVLDSQLSEQFKAFCTEHQATLFMGLVACTYALLYQYTAQEDIVVGTTVSGREHPDLENQVGFYVGVLALRTQFSKEDSFGQLLTRVRETIITGFAHQDYPFDRLIDQLPLQRDTSRSPLFDVLVEFLNVSADSHQKASMPADHPVDASRSIYALSKYDLSFKFDELQEGILLSIEYNTDLFTRPRVEAMLAHFEGLVREVLQNRDRPIGEIAYLPETEKSRILYDFNQTQPTWPVDKTLIQLFEEQVEKTPEAIAIQYAEQTWTYQQLNQLANQLAQGIQETSRVGEGDVVGILLDRSEKVVAAVWAVLKTEAAFLFIDPAYPESRKQYMLNDANVQLLVTSMDYMFDVAGYYGGALYVVETEPHPDSSPLREGLLESLPESPSLLRRGLRETAYLLYTSGSTGTPKGVQISQESIANYILWANQYYFQNQSGYTVPLFTSLSFDLTLTSLFSTLLRGDTLVIFDDKEIDQLLIGIFGKESVCTAVKITPSHISMLGDLNLSHTGVQKVIIGGEALKPRHVEILRTLNPDIQLYNEYGPTETTVGSTIKEIGLPYEQITIGTPIAHTEIYIVDNQLQPVPIGVPGEILIGGKGVALGYCQKPELTAERFIPNPVKADARMVYRTGDLGKWLPNGEIVLLGRKDHQVKLRGFRIELEEIENVLLRNPALSQVAVLPVWLNGEVDALAAYLESTDTLDIPALQRQLAESLPDYMLPAQWVQIEKIPLTSNGKIDREKLYQLRPESNLPQQTYVAPRTPLEKELTRIWQEVLVKDKIGIQDDFFRLGGHSLKATQIVSRVYQKLNLTLDIGSIFIHPTIERLATILAEKAQTAYEEIPVVAEQPYYEVSPTQKRLWITEQLTEGMSVYNSCGSYLFDGQLDIAILEQVFQTLIERHEILRSTFVPVNGTPKLKVLSSQDSRFALNYVDVRMESDKDARTAYYSATDARTKFDLANGPLLRIRLVHLEDEKYVFLFTMHHIISDGWSMNLLMSEFLTLYQAYNQKQENPLLPLRIQYKDYAAWLHQKIRQDDMGGDKAYWIHQFQGIIPVLEMPLEHPRPKNKTYNGSNYTLMLPKDISEGLKNLSVESGNTLFITLLASLKALLYRYTHQSDMVIGTVEAGRQHPDLENQIGIYIHTLALRTQFNAEDSFEQLLDKVKTTVLGAYAHKFYPFDQMLEDLQLQWDASRSPLFDIALSLENTDVAIQEQAPDAIDAVQVKGYKEEVWSSVFDLVIHAKDTEYGLLLHFLYNTDLFSEAYMQRFARHLEGIIRAILQTPQQPVYALSYLSDHEIHDLTIACNDTATDYPTQATIQSLFEAQAAQQPDQTAVIFHHKTLTYGELNEQANRLAHYLKNEYQIQPNDIIGLMLDKSEQVLVCILGILKAGATWLPIDPAYPEERKMYLLSDAGVEILLTDSAHMCDLDAYAGALIAIDSQMDGLETSTENPIAIHTPSNAAYVIYTSGSTGQPKGVVVAHTSNINMALDQIRRFSVTSTDRVLQFASISFDASVYEICMGLYAGATVVMADRKIIQSTDTFVQYLKENQVTIVVLPPAYLRILDLSELNFLRVIITAGEAANVADAVACSQFAQYYNAYGPTEAAVCVSTYQVTAADAGRERIPIGRPIANTHLYILDSYQQLVPVGVEGELYISGVGLAQQYLHRPELTAEKFVPDPFVLGQRMYWTGDVCKRNSDGTIDFVGRNDHQIKLRGFRIELGEIASVIRTHEGVADAYVWLAEDGAEKKLVACVTPDPIQAFALAHQLKATEASLPHLHTHLLDFKEAIQTYALSKMPDYMVPAELHVFSQLPLTVHGKVDKEALQKLVRVAAQTAPAERIPPRTRFEKQLAAIWEEVLHIDQVGITDHFFELGGNSLKATQVVARVYKEMQVRLELSELFQHATIEALALVVSQAERVVYEPIPLTEPAPTYALSHAQRRILIETQLEEENKVYNITGGYFFDHLNREAFEYACQKLVSRHEILRTTFVRQEDEYRQKIHPIETMNFAIDYEDVSQMAHPQAYVQALFQKESTLAFDLSTGPLFRAKLLQLEESQYVFLFTVHHIIFDAHSMQIVIQEILTQYQAQLTGHILELPPLRIQYKDYTEWQLQQLKGEHLHQHRTYWLSQFSGEIPVLALPTDFPRPVLKTYNGHSVPLTIDTSATEALEKLAYQHGCSMFMAMQAITAMVLYRLTRQTDLVIGIAEAGRNHPDLENQIGFYINTLALRTRFEEATTFTQLLNQVKETTLGAYRHMIYPFDQLVEDLNLIRDTSRSPLFDVGILYEERIQTEEAMPETEATSPMDARLLSTQQTTSQLDLKFAFTRLRNQIVGEIVYNSDLFEEETLIYIQHTLTQVVSWCLTHPDAPLETVIQQTLRSETQAVDVTTIEDVDF